MKRILLALSCCAATLTVAPDLRAAPAPADLRGGDGPTLVVQTSPIDAALEKVNTLAKMMVPPGSTLKPTDFKEMAREQFPGVDLKRGIGLYATLKDPIFASEAVLLVPVSDGDAFVKTLQHLGVVYREGKEYDALEIPNVPVPVYLTFADDYAYLSVTSSAPLEPKNRLRPAAVISPEEKAILTLRVRIDRVPDSLKEFALAQLDSVAGMIANPPPGAAPTAWMKVLRPYLEWATRFYKDLFRDGRELAYRYDLDPKKAELIVDATIEAKEGTELARRFNAIKPTTNAFAALAGEDDVGQVLLSLPLSEPEFKKVFANLTELVMDEAQKEGPEELSKMYAAFRAGVLRTIDGGDADLAAAVRGPDKDGHYTVVGAVSFKDTSALAAEWRKAAAKLPADLKGVFKFDVAKAGDVAVHEAAVGDKLPLEVVRTFTQSSVYYAFAPDAIYVSFGAGAPEALKRAIEVKPVRAPLVRTQVDLKKFMELARTAGIPGGPGAKDAMEAQLAEKLGKVNLITMSVEGGGNKMTVKGRIGAFALGASTYAALWQAAPAPRAVPPVPPPFKD